MAVPEPRHAARGTAGRRRPSGPATSRRAGCAAAAAPAPTRGPSARAATAANGGSGRGGGACVGAGRGEGVERGVEPGGGRGVQLAPTRAEPQPLEQAADGVALTDRGHVAMVTRQCSSNVRNRPGARPRRAPSMGIPWDAWPARSVFCSSWRSRCSGGARARRLRGRGRRRRPTRRRWPALQDKVDAIAQDSCTTRPAVQAYPDCARYVAEVGNAALATQGAAASVAGADALQATATRLADEVGQFSRTGCVAAPGRGRAARPGLRRRAAEDPGRPHRDAHPARPRPAQPG